MRRRHYPSGIIGMDVKPRRHHRMKANRYVERNTRRWLAPTLLAITMVTLAFLAGYWS